MMDRLTNDETSSILKTHIEETPSWVDIMNQAEKRYIALAEYEQAEENGLLVRLPCKVGDMLYMPTRDFVSEFVVCSLKISMHNNIFLHTEIIKGIIIRGEVFNVDEIGKTIFLTREEAERALKEAQENA